MRAASILACCFLGACVATQAAPDEITAVACPRAPGTYPGPYVADEETARAIALAIVEAQRTPEYNARYELRLMDQGDYWLAYQYPIGASTRIRGGGGLQMRIAKCDGAVSGVSFQR